MLRAIKISDLIVPGMAVFCTLFLSRCLTTSRGENEEYERQVSEVFEKNPEVMIRHDVDHALDAIPTQEDFESYQLPLGYGRSYKKLTSENLDNQERIFVITKILEEGGTTKFENSVLYLELVNLYSRQFSYLHRLEASRFVVSYEKWRESPAGQKEPTLSYEGSKGVLYKKLDILRNLVRDDVNKKESEMMLYQLLKTLCRLGNENSEYYANQFLRKYSKSPLIGEVYLALGNYYLDRGNLDKAVTNFKESMKYRESPAYAYAVYKLGWAYLKKSYQKGADKNDMLGKSKTAMKLVVKTLENTKSSRSYDLRDEAIFDLGLIWMETGEMSEAFTYFHRIENDQAFYTCLERRGDLLFKSKKYDESVKIYGQVLREDPQRESSPQIHFKMAEAYYRDGKKGESVKSLIGISQLLSSENVWNKRHSKNEKLMDSTRRHYEEALYRYGITIHQESQKKHDEAGVLLAAEIYRPFIANFPSSKNINDIRFNMGSIYFVVKDYEKAAHEFETIVKNNPADESMLRNSAYNLIIAINSLDQLQKYPPTPPVGKAVQPIPLPPLKQRLIASIDHYAELFPDDKIIASVKYDAAYMYHAYGNYDASLPRFEWIALKYPKSDQGRSAVQMTIAYLYEKQEWDRLIERCEKYLEVEQFRSGQLGELLNASLQEARETKNRISQGGSEEKRKQ
ncbi:MAG: tetratricopeptide repeat protein [Oligoflexales bacterium]|nr:tetratricopeptide repeat protein [Oligoflexales bacterium]